MAAPFWLRISGQSGQFIVEVTVDKALKRLVPTEGVEPTRYRYHWILSPARLPIPPRRHEAREYRNRNPRSKTDYSAAMAFGGPKISDAITACRAVLGLRISAMVWTASTERARAGTVAVPARCRSVISSTPFRCFATSSCKWLARR